LFAEGTSSSSATAEENNGKGLQKTRIESRFHHRDVLITTRGYKPQTMKGIIGKKIGMTSIFAADGKQTACTIIEAAPNTVTQVKTIESDGYTAFN
jgi:hypothetical protein